MRIGILTLPLHANYGGILQAYALQTVLLKMGHEVEVLDLPDQIHRSMLVNSMTFVKRLCMRIIGKNVCLNYQKDFNEREKAKRKYVNVFIKRYVKRRVLKRFDKISPNDYDAIVVGSDQVWRQSYMPQKKVDIPFLMFTKGWKIKRIAYAVSFGAEEWHYSAKETEKAKLAIQRFDAISTREDSGVILCKNYLNYEDAVQVLDPTLLLNAIDYMQIIDKSDLIVKPKGSLMVYLLDSSDEKHRYINECSKILGMEPYDTNSKYEVLGASLDEIVQPPVEQWLNSLKESSFVITDSFHACVFSILFHKPFIVIGNEGRGMARFQSLLSQFGLKDRLITNNFDVKYCKCDINWEEIEIKLSKLRLSSMSFLNGCL